jgi:hypothetical protein
MDTKPRIGQKVSVDDPKYPGVWIVKNTGPVNATLMPENGGRGLRAPYYMLTEPGAPSATPDGAVRAVYFHEGEIVRIGGNPKYAGMLWVVIRDRGDDRVNLAKLGGDGGRYLRYPRRNLTKVDPAEVGITG